MESVRGNLQAVDGFGTVVHRTPNVRSRSQWWWTLLERAASFKSVDSMRYVKSIFSTLVEWQPGCGRLPPLEAFKAAKIKPQGIRTFPQRVMSGGPEPTGDVNIRDIS